MGAKIVRLPQIATPTSEQVLEEFLITQRARLKAQTQKQYEVESFTGMGLGGMGKKTGEERLRALLR